MSYTIFKAAKFFETDNVLYPLPHLFFFKRLNLSIYNLYVARLLTASHSLNFTSPDTVQYHIFSPNRLDIKVYMKAVSCQSMVELIAYLCSNDLMVEINVYCLKIN
jgi:hypothetical protein